MKEKRLHKAYRVGADSELDAILLTPVEAELLWHPGKFQVSWDLWSLVENQQVTSRGIFKHPHRHAASSSHWK